MDLEIDDIKKALSDFAKQVKMERTGMKTIQRKTATLGKLKKLKTRGDILHLTWQ